MTGLFQGMRTRTTQARIDEGIKAIRALEARGIRPSGRSVGTVAGWYLHPSSGLNGRDSQAYAAAMTACGYKRPSYESSKRWTKA